MKNILIPTDFSQEAGYATELAMQLAKQSQAHVHLLNIVEMPISAVADPMGAPVVHDWNADFVKTLTQTNQEKIDAILKANASRASITTEVKVGVMLDSTMDYCEKNEVDLIVMGTKGASGLKEILIGSNAEKIVRFSKCPVITVAQPMPLKDIEDMIFGIDVETDDEARVVSQLKALQEALRLKIHFVYINTPHVIVNEDEVIEKMRSFVRENEFENYTVNVRKSTVSHAGILEFAQEMRADLIGMSTHSRKGLAHLFRGSLAEEVVNHSPLPVWTISLN